jgi:hypothetical protein
MSSTKGPWKVRDFIRSPITGRAFRVDEIEPERNIIKLHDIFDTKDANGSYARISALKAAGYRKIPAGGNRRPYMLLTNQRWGKQAAKKKKTKTERRRTPFIFGKNGRPLT